MIEEVYVSSENAKLLKDKGFDEVCWYFYSSIDTDPKRYGVVPYKNSEIGRDFICCPTQQMAMKWLRDIHNLFIQVFILTDNGYWFYIDKLLDNYNHRYLYSTGSLDIYYPTYEEACEAGIRYCLENLIV